MSRVAEDGQVNIQPESPSLPFPDAPQGLVEDRTGEVGAKLVLAPKTVWHDVPGTCRDDSASAGGLVGPETIGQALTEGDSILALNLQVSNATC